MSANPSIAIYLNDHLAGATAAMTLLDRMQTMPDIADLARELQKEIGEDVDQLKSLMAHLKIEQSYPRRAMGWLAETFTEVKLFWDDDPNNKFAVFESLEMLFVGIEGKLALWNVLETISTCNESLKFLNYAKLAERAMNQKSKVDLFRRAAAKKAFCDPA